MAKFDVLEPLQRDRKRHEPGSSIEISNKVDIEALIESGTIGEPGSYEALQKLNNPVDLIEENKALKAELAALKKGK